jgi:hypothetical protein
VVVSVVEKVELSANAFLNTIEKVVVAQGETVIELPVDEVEKLVLLATLVALVEDQVSVADVLLALT